MIILFVVVDGVRVGEAIDTTQRHVVPPSRRQLCCEEEGEERRNTGLDCLRDG